MATKMRGMMFLTILKFEWKYWLRNTSFYVYSVVFFFMALLAMAGSAGIFGEGTSSVEVANSPMSLWFFATFFNKLLLFLLPVIVGASIYKDWKDNVHAVLYSYPFTKRDYLLGKFLSSFLVVLFIALIVLAGLILGTMLPGVNAQQAVPLDIGVFLQIFFIYLVPNLLMSGVLVFAVVAFTRNNLVGFITIIVLLLSREALSRITGGLDYAGFLTDPFGETATNFLTRNWTPAERNHLPIPIGTAMILNRLLWISIAAIVFLVVYRRFSFSQNVEMAGRKAGWKNSRPERKQKNRFGRISEVSLPETTFNYTFFQQVKTVWRLSRSDFHFILKRGSFLSILLAGILFIAILLLQINPQVPVRNLPVTWVVLGYPVFFFSWLILILTFLHAGNLLHRARTARMEHLLSITPAPDWVFWLSKLLALIKMQAVLLSVILIVGIAVQIGSGYYHLEIGHYLFDLFGIHLVGFVIWALASLFVQTIFTNPYLGLFTLVIGLLFIDNLPSLGVESPLFRFNQNPEPGFWLNYSDMTGYGHSLLPYFLYKTYWLVGAMMLGCFTLLLWQRELTESFSERIQLARFRWNKKLAILTVFLFASFVGTGLFLYKEELIASTKQLTPGEENRYILPFQQRFNQYRNTEQPRIVSLFVNLQIHPEKQSFEANGHYFLINKTSRRIDTLLIKSGYDEQTELLFPQEVEKIEEDTVLNFTVYKLKNGIAPQDSFRLAFTIKNRPNTLLSRNSPVSANGAFIKSDIFPRFGYFANTEKRMPTDSLAIMNHYQSIDEDGIDFEAIVSTSSGQKAIAPGYLQQEWTEKDRQYFHYKMDRKIKFVFDFHSGVYENYREDYKGIELTIWYHKPHSYSLNSMMDGLKCALDYNTTNFGNYQHRQIQLIEFPKSAGTYATTAANCISVSEIRFINDTKKLEQGFVDLSFYVAAHELSHRWWGNQLIPADALGALMLTESLAEYTTAKIYEKKYGKQRAIAFLQIQLNRYQKGRAADIRQEQPLVFVEPEQSHIAYGKGAIAFYLLSEYIGEDKLNRALKAYLNRNKFLGPPYATSVELVDFLKQATPDSLQYVISDLFENPAIEKLLFHFNRLPLD